MIVEENGTALAFVGDALWSLYVRKYLLKSKNYDTNLLQKRSINYVSAKAQAKILQQLIDENFFDEMDLQIIARGKNAKGGVVPKNTTPKIYHFSTAFEALIGFYELYDQSEKLQRLIKRIFKENV